MPFSATTDGPPPSPATDPAAAKEVGRPSAQVAQLTAGSALAAQPTGPDVSGILSLGQKLVEGLLALAQAAPLIAPDMDQAQELVMNALAKFSAGAATGTGTSSSAPMPGPAAPAPAAGGPPAKGQVIGQAGAQFPGAVSGNSRPF